MKRLRFAAPAALAAAGLVTGIALFQRAAPGEEPAKAAGGPLAPDDWPLADAERRGRDVYEKYCVGCHGDQGKGDGSASRFLDPQPRNFQTGFFKFRSTTFGAPPMPEDLLRTVTCGLPGSSMPGFPLVPEIQRKDVVAYVMHLAKFGKANRVVAATIADEGTPLAQIRAELLPVLRAEIDRAYADVKSIPVSEAPDATPESVERGRKLFSTSCASCHGATGVGDGTSSIALRDDLSAVIRPRDFTTGVFRAGSRPEDLFIRVKGGLSGTPMPSFANMSDADVWDMVHFILSLKDPRAAKPKMPPGCGHEGGSR